MAFLLRKESMTVTLTNSGLFGKVSFFEIKSEANFESAGTSSPIIPCVLSSFKYSIIYSFDFPLSTVATGLLEI